MLAFVKHSLKKRKERETDTRRKRRKILFVEKMEIVKFLSISCLLDKPVASGKDESRRGMPRRHSYGCECISHYRPLCITR